MGYATLNPAVKERDAVIKAMRRLHITVDKWRCHEFIQRHDLDDRFDSMLALIDDVVENIPEIERDYP